MKRRLLLSLLLFTLWTPSLLATAPQLKIVVPKFSSQGTAVDAFKNLEKVSKESDPQKLGIRIIFNSKKPRKVNLSLDNMPVSEILRYICLSAGYKYKITNRTVNIVAP